MGRIKTTELTQTQQSKLDSLAAAGNTATTTAAIASASAGLLIVRTNMAAFEWDCDCGWSEWDLDSTEWTTQQTSSSASSSKPSAIPPPPPPPFFDLPPPPLPPSLQPPPELCSSSVGHPLGLETCQAFLVIVPTNKWIFLFILSSYFQESFFCYCFSFSFFNLFFSFFFIMARHVCVFVSGSNVDVRVTPLFLLHLLSSLHSGKSLPMRLWVEMKTKSCIDIS